MKKYVSFKNPLTGMKEYFKQSGPIYGEASAPARWERTFAPWLESIGFKRGKNEPAVFYHPVHKLTVLLYVDDIMARGPGHHVRWLNKIIDDNWATKPAEWLEMGKPLDYVGMDIAVDENNLYISMANYINTMLTNLNLDQLTEQDVPIEKAIDTESRDLNSTEKMLFMSGIGCLGWLSNTARPDISYAHSRLAQHLAKPNLSALKGLMGALGYLKKHVNLCLVCPRKSQDKHISTIRLPDHSMHHSYYTFYSDADFASNAEKQNKRRSQNGGIAMCCGAPVFWMSKAHSKCWASGEIQEAHADTSSGAAEVYAAGNFTKEMMFQSYVIEELGMTVVKPMVLQVDNAAAEVFANDTCVKSQLKHIDCRQEWVIALRDPNLVKCVHVDTKDNLADMFTKILDKETFEGLRDRCMGTLPLKLMQVMKVPFVRENETSNFVDVSVDMRRHSLYQVLRGV